MLGLFLVDGRQRQKLVSIGGLRRAVETGHKEALAGVPQKPVILASEEFLSQRPQWLKNKLTIQSDSQESGARDSGYRDKRDIACSGSVRGSDKGCKVPKRRMPFSVALSMVTKCDSNATDHDSDSDGKWFKPHEARRKNPLYETSLSSARKRKKLSVQPRSLSVPPTCEDSSEFMKENRDLLSGYLANSGPSETISTKRSLLDALD